MKLNELREAMAAGNSAETPTPTEFHVEKSELQAQLNFASPFWPIAQNISSLYSGLLNRMREFGVSSHSIRPDAADGSLGAFNVNFWMLQWGVIVRIRLDSVEFSAPNFAVDPDQLEPAFLAVDQSLRDAKPDLSYSNSAVTIVMHGRLSGTEPKQFLERFVTHAPDGLGRLLGCGTVFYFEGPSPLALLSVTADLSSSVAGGLVVKVHTVFDESMKMDALRAMAEQQLERSVKALGLVLPAGTRK